MTKKNTQTKAEIDLKDESLGRAASRAALILRGKENPNFQPNNPPRTILEVKNVNMLKIDEKKLKQKFYKRYTGYPSGLRKENLGELYKKNPQKVFLKAVKGMLPANKLRKEFLKNIIFVK